MASQNVVQHNGPGEIKSKKMKVNAFWMFVIGVTMWIGVPVLWLFIGSQIKASSDSLGLALAVMIVGALVMIVVLIRLLGSLNRSWHEEYERLNERRPQRTPLEPVLVISVMIALAVFGVYFFFFAGPSSNFAPQV